MHVANEISEILEGRFIAQYCHVPSERNTVDLICVVVT